MQAVSQGTEGAQNTGKMFHHHTILGPTGHHLQPSEYLMSLEVVRLSWLTCSCSIEQWLGAVSLEPVEWHTGVEVALLMCMTRAGAWFALLAVSQTLFWCMLEFGRTAKPGPSACIGAGCSHYFNDLSSFKCCCSQTPVFFFG